MITGYISARHALVPLTVSGPNGQGTVDFVLDTGFAGFLTLSQKDVTTLGLVYSHPMPAHLADGSRVMVSVYKATVLWDGQTRDIEVLATGGERLLGTSLLDGYDVRIQFTHGGVVIIERI